MQAGKFWYRKCILTETANVGNVNLKWEMRVDFVHNVQDNVDVPKQCLYRGKSAGRQRKVQIHISARKGEGHERKKKISCGEGQA